MKCVQVDSPSHMYLAGLGMIPTHNSTIAAGLGLYLLVADGEEGAEVYSAATDVKQASIVHNEAVSMVGRSQELDRLLYINRTTKTIAYKDTSSAYKVLANNPKTNDGWNAHAIIADELHKWSGRELYDALRYAFAARDQPLFFQITTAGDSPLSICKEQHDYTLSVNSGAVIDERFHGVIYAADPSDNPLDEKVWKKANPSLGETISYESFRADAMEAAKSPVSMTAFKRYRLNIWTTGESPWLNQTDWAACRRDFCPEELEGSVCYAGLDLAKTQDTTSLQLVFRGEEEGEFQLLSYFWLPEETARNQSVVPWEQWAEQGHVFLTPGSVCDYSFVKQTIAQLAQDFKIQSLAYDSWGAAHLVQDLQDNVGLEVVEFGQGISHFAGPTAEFERLILGGKLHHVGQPVMDWQVGNAQIRVDSNGNKKPSKRSAKDHRKVDGVVAAIMALALAVDDQDVASVYDLPQEDRVLFL